MVCSFAVEPGSGNPKLNTKQACLESHAVSVLTYYRASGFVLRDKAVIRGVRHAIHHETDSGHCRRHRRGGRVAVVSSVETVEKSR
jgi:hypothetical protein